MHYIKKQATFEAIRDIPAIKLLQADIYKLRRIEWEISAEIERAELSLKWVRGIMGIKKSKKDGGNNG